MSVKGSNAYYVCYSYEEDPRVLDLSDVGEAVPGYIAAVLQAAERRLGPRGLRVYVTWKLDTLPAYGDGVVAIVMGDEWARYPTYASDVLVTFKAYGTRPSCDVRLGKRSLQLNAMLALKYARSRTYGVPGALRRAAARAAHHAGRRGPLPPVLPIPLGYGNQLDLHVKPLVERSTDLFFAGSIAHRQHARWDPRGWVVSPKTLAREEMLGALANFHTAYPGHTVQVNTTTAFTLNDLHYGTGDHTRILSAEVYSDALMDTRLCLTPQGTSPETFRYYEGLRYGCVVVAEPQPARWFYDDAPVVEITDWERLPEVAAELLGDPERMNALHHAALRWWADRCSEEAVGTYVADGIEQQFRTRSPRLYPGAMAMNLEA